MNDALALETIASGGTVSFHVKHRSRSKDGAHAFHLPPSAKILGEQPGETIA